MQLTAPRRSQLLETLLKQQVQPQPDIRSGGELLAKLLAQGVRQAQISRLRKEEAAAGRTTKANEAAVLNKLAGGGDVDIHGRPIMDRPGVFLGERPQQQNNISLAQALGQLGSDNPLGAAVSGKIVEQAFTTPKPAEVKTGQFREGDDYVTRLVTDGVPGKEIARSPIDRVQRIDQTTRTGPLTESDISKTVMAFRDATISTSRALRQGIRLKQIASTNPEALGTPGNMFSMGNNLLQTGKALLTHMGFDPEVDFGVDDVSFKGFDVGPMRETAINNAQFRAGVFGIAFAAAVAVQGTRPTDKDVQAFIDQIAGSSSDPLAFSATIDQFMNLTVQQLRDQAFLSDIPAEELNRFNELINPLIAQFPQNEIERDYDAEIDAMIEAARNRANNGN